MAKRVELKALVDLAGEHASRVILGLHQPLAPSWVLVGANRKVRVMATPWRDDADKELIAHKMRATIRKHAIVAYSFISEAWVAIKPPGWTPEANADFVRPMHDPQRQECVIAMATDGTNYEWRCWVIKRNHLEEVTRLEPKDDFAGGAPAGWMTELLKS